MCGLLSRPSLTLNIRKSCAWRESSRRPEFRCPEFFALWYLHKQRAMRCDMSFFVRAALSIAALLCAGAVSVAQNTMQKPVLEEISTGKTRIIDLSYAISDKMVPWPGDAKAFEATVNATIDKH